MAWRYVEYEGYWEVYPDDEYYQHDFKVWQRFLEDGTEENKSKCACKPRVIYQEVEPFKLIIVHNSFDGREGVEWANEILK